MKNKWFIVILKHSLYLATHYKSIGTSVSPLSIFIWTSPWRIWWHDVPVKMLFLDEKYPSLLPSRFSTFMDAPDQILKYFKPLWGRQFADISHALTRIIYRPTFNIFSINLLPSELIIHLPFMIINSLLTFIRFFFCISTLLSSIQYNYFKKCFII